MVGTTTSAVRPGLFSRVGVNRKSRPDSSQGSANGDGGRPLSARGSFVDRLRSMQITTSSRPPASSSSGGAATGARRATTGSAADSSAARLGATGGPRREAGARAPAAARLRRAGLLRPRSSSGTPLGTRRPAGTGASTAAGARNGRATPPPAMRASEPTGGLRTVGATTPPPRSPGKLLPPRDVSPVKTHKSLGVRPTGARSPFAGLKVGITLMTRKPHRFDWWLRYHRSLGIYHVFVHVEERRSCSAARVEEFADFVTVTTGNDGSVDTHNPNSTDNYYTLMQRQERQVRRSVQECRGAGIDWLFHVDDDELLYFDTPFSRIVDGLAPGVTCVVLVNIEAVPRSLAPECVFEDIEVFTQHKMLAYRNGKSAGRVADADWHGPHRFTGSYHVVPVATACVLHFESCIYEQWRNKFIKHRDIDEQKKRNIPFPFYRDSISLFQGDHDGGKDEERWKQFFRERKIGNFADLTESQKTRLALSTNMPQMINA